MKKILSDLSVFMLAVVLCVGMSACGGGDDDGAGGGDGGSQAINVAALVGKTFYKTETYTGGENVETKKYSLTFKTQYFATVSISGNGVDDDGTYRWDYGEKDCPFSISGNEMTIEYKGDKDYQETLRLVFRNNRPEGWSGGDGGSTVVTPGDTEPATAGTAQMIGYYFPDGIYQVAKNEGQRLYQAENTKDWTSYIDYNDLGYRIVDASTIHVVEMGALGADPTKKGYNAVVLASDNYTLQRKSYGVYYYAFDFAKEELRYVVKGTTLQLSNGKTITYSNGKLTEGTRSYTKIK